MRRESTAKAVLRGVPREVANVHLGSHLEKIETGARRCLGCRRAEVTLDQKLGLRCRDGKKRPKRRKLRSWAGLDLSDGWNRLRSGNYSWAWIELGLRRNGHARRRIRYYATESTTRSLNASREREAGKKTTKRVVSLDNLCGRSCGREGRFGDAGPTQGAAD